MFKTILTLPLLLLFSSSADKSVVRLQQNGPVETGTLEKMMVASGSVSMDLDLKRLNGGRSHSQLSSLHFSVAPNSFFTILVFNNDLRGPEPGSMLLIPQGAASLPAALSESFNQLVVEKIDWTQPFDLAIRDGKTGFTFFNIEGNVYDYDTRTKLLSVKEGRLRLAKEFAEQLGRPLQVGSDVGRISVEATMRPIEITQVVNGEASSSVMPSMAGGSSPATITLVGGPDVIVGDLTALQQFGSSGTQVGLAVGTDSCNAGAEPLHWFALPSNDHPVIPQNLYRMSGGATNDQRFEQVGQSWLKHAFTALTENICGFGCQSPGTGTLLGAGCSDPYTASLNSGGTGGGTLGSRAWVNPFTGVYPRGDSATNPRDHTGHTHNGTSHRVLVEVNDLNTTLNPGATYFAEAQYVTPHEYVWCQAHAGQCNMNNNVSYRQYSVSGTSSFTFSSVGATERSKPALTAWLGATINQFEPDPANDGIGFVGYKVTNPSPGVWHYEYAVYNQDLDRAIQSFSVPLGPGVSVSNTGFHAPPQHPAWAADGTVGNAGYSSTPWSPIQTAGSLTWNTETFAVNPNANAIRWGTLYNFRFDSNHAPVSTNATVGFFKNGTPIMVQIQAPGSGLPDISITDVTVTEGNAGTIQANFNVNLSSTSTDTVTVQYATADDLATAGSDYVAASGMVTFTPGQLSQPVSITVNGDSLEEPNETFFVNLNTPVNGNISDGQGVGRINNDDVLATLPSGFGETQIAGLSSPTAMSIHPDGRVFVCQQSGALRVIKNGVLLPTPFTTLTVNSSGERGLLGIAFDPNYATNHFIYVYYTATTPSIHNRVSRFTADIANEDVAVVGSELAILDLENLGATNHNGGAIHFGPDGKLYVAVGENANSSNSQVLTNRLGKMLRINSDGTIPADNPTTFPNIAGSPTGNNRAIWAVGLRNPFTFSFQQGTGRMHINDVGEGTWEEIDLGVAGANYGWGGGCEGACGVAGMTNPIYQYSSAGSPECAITGGAFYNPTTPTFPAQYIGKYFFSDFCAGWMKTIDPLSPPATGAASGFATGISSPVDIQVADDGSLYYLARGTNSVFRVQYFGGPTLAINDLTITEGNAGTSVASFTVLLSPASSQTVTVQYATANNTAFSGTDYVAASGTLTFTPGQLSQPVNVTINGDTTFEPTETFNVNLSNPTIATIGDSQGVGTISNDDTQPTISIDDVAVTEGNSGTTTATFTVSLSNTSSQQVSVNYTTAGNTATSGTDFVSAGGTAIITPGLLTQTISVTVNGDTTFEANETFNVNLTNPTNATISDNQGVGTINNDDSQPTISINDVSVTEGTTTAGFTVTLSNASSQTITVNYATADNTATAGADYVTASGTVTFTAGQTTQPINVTVTNDTVYEPGANETFNVNLSSPSNATIADNQGVGTITDNDSQPTISINDVSVTEGNAGTITAGFTIALSNASSQTITVNYVTANNTATAGSDYVSASGTITFTAGQTIQPVNVTVNGDPFNEPDEIFNVNLSIPANATIVDPQGVGTIANDDPVPSLSINDVSMVEGNAGTTTAGFTVSLSAPSGQTVTVNYTTANVSATAGSDYVTASGTLTFTPGQSSQPISVTVNGDLFNEQNETFNVNLSAPANATIADNLGVGTITNDDPQPSLSVNDVLVTEGNSGTTTATFTVSLSAASGQTVTVNYATANGTATAGSDYVSTSGILTFTAGQLTQPISVTVNGDNLDEDDSEDFRVNLSSPANATIADSQGVGTINDDDAQPGLSINDVSVTEGNAGTATATFTVSLSAASGRAVSVNYATANNTATAGADYVATNGTVNFTPGQTTQPINVTVNADLLNEANETFFVNLSTASNATISDNQGQGTINDDDSQPTLSINDVSVTEGNSGTTSATFTISLSAASGQTVSVNYATADGTASAGSDYLAASGTLVFAPGDLSKPLPITVNGDTAVETDEAFVVNLSSPTNAAIADNQGQGTILKDDFPPLFEFTQANFNQSESSASVLITVKRTGDLASAATVDFQTTDSLGFVECSAVSGHANQRCDYLLTSGTLSFAANELEKSFSVIIYNDAYQEGNETINLSLSNSAGAGAQLGSQSTATVTILDDDSGAPATNPIDEARFFVRQNYFDFLQRLPDQAGEDYWTGVISACGADPVCIDNSRTTVADAFFFEPEYQQSAGFVLRLYRIAFGNNQPFPNPGTPLNEAKKLPSYAAFLSDRARVVGGSSLAAAQLSLANAFVLRPEFLSKYPGTLTGPEFVDALLATNRNDLGVEMISQRPGLIAQFNSGGRGAVMYRLADDNAATNPIDNRALIDAEYNRSLVLSQYFGFLRRDPDVAGFLFWLGQANSGPLHDINKQHAMVCSFITSQEYQQRFGAIVTRTNANCH